MGELYDRMAQDLKLKNLAAKTREQYLRCCSDFVRYHMKSPRELGETAIKQYLGHLVLRGAGPEVLKMRVKFLYGVTLDRPKVAERIPWPKVPQKKPEILSGSEVAKLLKAVTSLVPAMALTTAYGAGLRVSEACRLRVGDIDGNRKLIHVRLGKGGKDRYVMLGDRLLEALRQYWVKLKPEGWLFPGAKKGRPLSPDAVRKALERATKAVRLKKRVEHKAMLKGLFLPNREFRPEALVEIAAFADALRNHVVDLDLATRPFENAARAELAAAGRSSTEAFFEEVVAVGIDVLITDARRNRVAGLLDERWDYQADGVAVDAVYDAYRHFAARSGFNALVAKQTLGKELRMRHPKLVKTRLTTGDRAYVYQGLPRSPK